MMPDLGNYAFSVLSAYGASIVLVAALIGVTWVQSRRAKARLSEIERRGKPGDV